MGIKYTVLLTNSPMCLIIMMALLDRRVYANREAGKHERMIYFGVTQRHHSSV